jgi:hypothetical protein
MQNLPYTGCPQCGNELPIKVLWDFSPHSPFDLVGRYGTLTGRIGILLTVAVPAVGAVIAVRAWCTLRLARLRRHRRPMCFTWI